MLKKRGFSLVEILVVMTLIALLLSISLPNYINSINNSKEIILKQNLTSLRVSIDQYYNDKGQYPRKIQDLVDDKYIRNIPLDPIENTNNWDLVYYNYSNGIYDVKSKSVMKSSKGNLYSEW